MYTFLVLGLIPGTDIQISFWAWIIIMIAVIAVGFRFKSYAVRHIAAWWHQFDDEAAVQGRRPLHASRLHLRGL